MTKRLIIISVCLIAGLSFSMQAFSQDEPVNTDDKVVNETDNPGEQPEEKTPSEGEKAEGTEPAAKTEITAEDSGKVYNSGDAVYVNTKVKFKLSSRDNVTMGEIFYKINDGEATKYENPITFAEEGKKKITYYGIDLNENAEMEKTYEVIVDNTGPEVLVNTSKPLFKSGETVYYSKDYAFTVSSSDKLSGVESITYSINNESKTYATSFNIKGDGDAEVAFKSRDNVYNETDEFSIKTIDAAGTESTEKVKSIKLTADNTAPAVTITPDKELKEKDGTKIAKTEYTYTLAADDKGSGVKTILYRVDGKGEFMPYSKAITFTTNGEHIIEAQAVDNVGNISDVAILKIVVDMIPPETMIETITR